LLQRFALLISLAGTFLFRHLKSKLLLFETKKPLTLLREGLYVCGLDGIAFSPLPLLLQWIKSGQWGVGLAIQPPFANFVGWYFFCSVT
jgi:uncharacterized membrane protein (DUF106 family)